MSKIIGNLTKDQFFKWSFHLEKLKNAKLNLALEMNKLNLQSKDIEILKLKTSLDEAKIKKFEQVLINAEKAYNETKQELEKELGLTLENVAIDDVTLEIVDLGE